MPHRVRVFISYSHDSDEHVQFVLDLAERLIEDGFNCVLDFSLEDAPAEGWQTWFAQELAAADYTLVMCTPKYLQRYQHQQAIAGEAEEFGGLVLTPALYQQFNEQTKFVPILREGGKLSDAPEPLQSKNTFELMADYLGLHQLLKNKQPKAMKGAAQTAEWRDSEASSPSNTKPPSPSIQNTPSAISTNANTAVKPLSYIMITIVVLVIIVCAFVLFF